MPLEKNMDNSNVRWNFTNILAFVTIIICMAFLYVAAFVLSKSDVKDNTMLSQITTGVLSVVVLILAYYFGSSSNSRQQQNQISEMQKTSTELAMKTADANVAASVTTKEIKVDKAVKIGELKAALEKLDPDSEDAKNILQELTELEKQT